MRVTPASGGGTTAFSIHFRALLNGADSGYRWSGLHCAGYFFSPGFSQKVVLRGGLVTTPLVPIPSRCAGTYRVSVRVAGFEPIGTLRPEGESIRARPFGAATLTVG